MRKQPGSLSRRLLAIPLAFVLAMGVAFAYWSTGSVPGGNGAAAATAVGQGSTPTASATGTSVAVSWTATTLTTGQAVTGYQINRYNLSNQGQAIGAGCAGTLTTLTCTESNVPSGSWRYTVTPVFATNWRGAESAKSNTVGVDTIAPSSAITLSSVTGDAYKNGNTIYYRGSSAGSLRLTNTVTDANSGPASSQTAALAGTSTGWTHTPSTVSAPAGGPYESNAFAWAAATTSGPTELVTSRDVAGNATTTTLTFANDVTAPAVSTVSFPNGDSNGSVPITFTTGTDTGSGIASRQLQRRVAPSSGGTCGTYGRWADLGPVNPTSPYNDTTLGAGACYQYQYVVQDNVGNREVTVATGTATLSYSATVSGTTGLLSFWRLGESATPPLTAADPFTDTAGKDLSLHTGELGTAWTRVAGTTGVNSVVTDQNRIRRSGAGYTIYTASQAPSTAQYAVEADLHYRGALAGDMLGLVGAYDTATTSGFVGRYEMSDQSWRIVKQTNGTVYYGGTGTFTASQPLTIGENYRLRLEMSGTTSTVVKLYVNGVYKAGWSEAAAPVTGRGGFFDGSNTAAVGKTDTTGLHLDNFEIASSTYTRAADSKGSNTGDYQNGVTKGAGGALAGDTNTAATFDGVNDHVQVTSPIGIPVAAATRSTEMWFKTSASKRQALFEYGTEATGQEYGLWLAADGLSMTAWGYNDDRSFTLASAANDGAWHHVALTYDGTSLRLYLDGVLIGTQAATRSTQMSSYGFGIGAVIDPSDPANSGLFFSGSIDEVALYTSVLSAAQVTSRYELGSGVTADTQGPSGGSVDATGLVGTGTRYSTSTTLSIATSSGTDPSGVATSGNELLRATATLSNGTCGAFGGYALVSGGNDPASPKTDTVTDQACYRYRYVVADSHGNEATYTSPDIKVDITAPTTPTLSFSTFTNTYWSGTGSTVYYRSAAASGSFRATAAASDPASGILRYTFPALGTGWTTATVSTAVRTYSWSGVPAAPGTKAVTATNNANRVSTGASFTMTADDTAPTAGTLGYLDGITTGTSVNVSFTTGTDGGSGIGTSLLQRASATLTGETCGAFGPFETVTNGTNPTSAFTDALPGRGCYQYQYVVADRVGNTTTTSSASVVKMKPTYVDTVSSTSGLLHFWRLGESFVTDDDFTGATGATLSSRSGATGASWTRHPVSNADIVLTAAGRIRKAGTTTGATYYSSGVPASADYTVSADLVSMTRINGDNWGIAGRVDAASNTFYLGRYEEVGTNSLWRLYSIVNGTTTMLASTPGQIVAGSTNRVGLEMSGTSIRLLVNGIPKLSVTNAAISAKGAGGVTLGAVSTTVAATTITDTTGMHLDNFRISPPLGDSAGTNTGFYRGGTLLQKAGAIAGDTNTAALFDGVSDEGFVSPVTLNDFSTELWFKSTQGIGTGVNWWEGAALVDSDLAGTTANDWGISLRADGRVVAGVGNADVSIISSAGGYNDGAWHQLVFTRAATGALVLYVDGAQVASGTGPVAQRNSGARISFGVSATGPYKYYAGSLDEIALYGSVLSAATVTAHYDAAG